MSAEQATTGTGRLQAEAGLGVVVSVTDGDGKVFGTGIARLDISVPTGLYAVGWSAAGSTAESIVRVIGGAETFVRPPWEENQPESSTKTEVFDLISRGLTASGGADFLVSNYGSTRSIDRSSLIVELIDPEGGRSVDVASDLCILDGSDREVDPVPPDIFPDFDNAKAWAEVTPGRYRLRFRALSGETLDQVVPVLKDRTTIVRMQVTNATVMIHGSEGFTNSPSRGVDPGRTIIVTSGVRDSRNVFDEQFRLAQLLLRDLALKQSSLSAEFLSRLREPGTDPLLRVYGALVILSRLEAGLPPTLDGEWPDGGKEAVFRTRHWCRQAADLLENAHRAGMPPDATVGLWQIERQFDGSVFSHSKKISASIRVPPMLECAWRWAIARTTIDRDALQDFASIRAAAKTAGGTSPWLCWSAAAAKGLQAPAPVASNDELDALVGSVAGKIRQLRKRQERIRSGLVSPDSLPAEAAATVLRVEQVLDRTIDSNREHGSDIAELSVALSLPLAALAARLILTDQALDQALDETDRQDARPDDDGKSDAPGWMRKVMFKNDPNRGRFGGRAERDGFRLEAEFSHTKSKNWATIHLALVGPSGFDGAAVIYLHNSFKPPRYRYRFKDGIVRDKLTAWGGFTVAAWIPSHGVELELNLAEVEGAPRIIRER